MSPQKEFSRISPPMASFSFPQRIYTVSLREGTTNFAFNGFIFISSKDFHSVSLRGNHRLCLQQLYTLHSPWGFTSYLLRENFHRLLPLVVFYFYPYWFSFYFSIPNSFVLPRTLFYFIVVMCDCVDSWASIYKWFHLLAFDLRSWGQLSGKRGIVDSPICTGRYLWSLVSVMII